MSKKIAVYGSYEAKVPVKQRYWKRRVDGIMQRYWKTKHGSFKTVEGKGRYEFHGQGRELYRAVVQAHRTVPKGYVDVSAEQFLKEPEKYGVEGRWIDRDIES